MALSRTRTFSYVSTSIQPAPSASETLASNANILLLCPSRNLLNGFLGLIFVVNYVRMMLVKKIKLCGWVVLHRVHGGLTFVNLKDHTNIVQVIALPDEFPDAHSAINDLRLEYVVAIEGVVRS